MRKFLIALTVLCLFSASIAWIIDTRYSPFLLQRLPVYVVNTQEKPLLLYDANNIRAPAVLLLQPDDDFRLFYAGDTGQWLYGWKNNRSVFLKSQDRLVAFVLNEKRFPVAATWKFFSALSLFLFMLMLSYKGYAKQPKPHHSGQYSRKERRYPTISERTPSPTPNHENRWLRQENYRLTQEIAKINQEKEDFIRREQRLFDAIHQSHSRASVTVPDMQHEYDALEKEYIEVSARYEKLKNDGKVFDINFDSSSYDSIIKGRKFEIFLARNLVENNTHSILEWTPDKGFDSSIRVKSNGNPDLVVQHKNGQQFAIECKFRGTHFRTIDGQQTDQISWSSVYAAERYQTFSVERRMPVFIALGWKGLPESPKRLFLAPLDQLIQLSHQNWYDPKDTENPYKAQYLVEFSKLRLFDASKSVLAAIDALISASPDQPKIE